MVSRHDVHVDARARADGASRKEHVMLSNRPIREGSAGGAAGRGACSEAMLASRRRGNIREEDLITTRRRNESYGCDERF